MSEARSWHPLRPEDPTLPELPGEGSVTVALVAAAEAREGKWAARAAAGMARAWAASGIPTYLCDLHLEAPELHDELGVENDEGVADLLLYGVSPRRVAHRVEEGLFVAPAGTVAADPGALRASPRWDSLVDGFAGAGALLLLFVPATGDGVDALLARADAVVLLRGPDETVELGEAADRLIAEMGPGSGGPVAAPSATASTTPEAERPETAADTAGGGGFGRWILILLVIVVLTIVLIGAMGWIEVPGLGAEVRPPPGDEPRSTEAMAPVPSPDRPAVPIAAPAEAPSDDPARWIPQEASESDAPLQAWGLTLEAHRGVAVAEDRIRQLSERWPSHLFWRAPVTVDDRVYHRIIAGPATSRAEVEGVRTTLGGGSDWIVRDTRWAFLLGELPDLVAARTLADALEELEVPTHILQVSPADGGESPSFRVYAGSYASEAEAATLRALLEDRGLGSAPFTERRGIVPE